MYTEKNAHKNTLALPSFLKAIKDGIVFDNKQLLADVAAMVAKQKEAIK